MGQSLKHELRTMAADLTSEQLTKIMRNGLNAVVRRMKEKEIALIAASQPERAQQVRKAVRGKLYRELDRIRIHLSKNLRKYPGGYSYTGRDSQPWLPLAYWYEMGIHRERTRGKDRRPRAKRSSRTAPARSYGSIAAWSGQHVLSNGLDDATIDALFMPEIQKALERFLKKHGF